MQDPHNTSTDNNPVVTWVSCPACYGFGSVRVGSSLTTNGEDWVKCYSCDGHGFVETKL